MLLLRRRRPNERRMLVKIFELILKTNRIDAIEAEKPHELFNGMCG